MNPYTVALLALKTEQKRFPRAMVEQLVEYIEAMRKENARLRNTVRLDIDGKTYEVERSAIAPQPVDVDDDYVLFFEPIPLIELKEV